MFRIYVKKQGERCGHVFKSHSSILHDKVRILPYAFVIAGLISSNEWANSQESIINKFNLHIEERKIDGRCKISKYMRYFSWRDILYK